MSEKKGIVMKFGGTSVGDPSAIGKAVAIVKASEQPVVAVVVSAYAGVTNELVEMASLAQKEDAGYKKLLSAFIKRHKDMLSVLLEKKTSFPAAEKDLDKKLAELTTILDSIALSHILSDQVLDLVMSFGEQLSASTLAYVFTENGIPAVDLDTRKLIVTDNTYGFAKLLKEDTYKNIATWFEKEKNVLPIVTGYIAATKKGKTTTLGRGGSDYTAAIVGAALRVSAIEIWTDVDGVKTADPRRVKNAFTIKNMTYLEAMEMSHFGAKVIYAPTMRPAIDAEIPLIIRNTFNPTFPGTVIGKTSSNGYPIKGISSIANISVLLLSGVGMVGVPGLVMRLFRVLAAKNINVVFITQASSEYTICFAIMPKDVEKATVAINKEFAKEMQEKILDPLSVQENLSILAIVGDHMQKAVGVSGKLFVALGEAGINIIAIAQGSSERSISVVINNNDEDKALTAIHKEFFEK